MAYKTQQNKKRLLEALEQNLCNVSKSCKDVGIDRSMYYEYIRNDEEFKKQVESLLDVQKDFVENKLFENVNEGKETSIIFYLKTKAKDRGYVERQEIEHQGGITIQLSKEDAKL